MDVFSVFDCCSQVLDSFCTSLTSYKVWNASLQQRNTLKAFPVNSVLLSVQLTFTALLGYISDCELAVCVYVVFNTIYSANWYYLIAIMKCFAMQWAYVNISVCSDWFGVYLECIFSVLQYFGFRCGVKYCSKVQRPAGKLFPIFFNHS